MVVLLVTLYNPEWAESHPLGANGRFDAHVIDIEGEPWGQWDKEGPLGKWRSYNAEGDRVY